MWIADGRESSEIWDLLEATESQLAFLYGKMFVYTSKNSKEFLS